MKTIKDKQLPVGADFAGYPLKEAVCEHLGDYPLKLETKTEYTLRSRNQGGMLRRAAFSYYVRPVSARSIG